MTKCNLQVPVQFNTPLYTVHMAESSHSHLQLQALNDQVNVQMGAISEQWFAMITEQH